MSEIKGYEPFTDFWEPLEPACNQLTIAAATENREQRCNRN